MVDLVAADWELAYDGELLEFGRAETTGFGIQTYSIGPPRTESDDADAPRGGFTVFGADRVYGRTIEFNLVIKPGTELEAAALRARFERVWSAQRVSATPGRVASLTVGGQLTVFGRPRWSAWSDKHLYAGILKGEADFDTVDARWYSADEHSQTIGLAAAPSGGLSAPLVAPLTSSGVAERSHAITVGGDTATPLRIELAGPITNPVIRVGELLLELSLTLAYDEVLVIDARPWARTVMVGDRSVAGSLSRRSSWLADLELAPGAYPVTLRGTLAGGNPALTVYWRDASASLDLKEIP